MHAVCMFKVLILLVSFGVFVTASDDSYDDVDFSDNIGDIVSWQEDETPGEILLTPKSKFCRTSTLGAICSFSKTKDTIRIESNAFNGRGNLEIEIHNPQKLLLNHVCIPWIQVFNAKYVETPPEVDETEAGCRTWLRILNSTVGKLTNGIKDITLVNSDVELIRLDNQRDIFAFNSSISSLEYLSWKGFSGFLLESSIEKISFLEAKDDLTIDKCRIGAIEKGGFIFRGQSLIISNSVIGSLQTGSLKLVSGKIMIENVNIGEVSQYGIVSKYGVDITMVNVSITNAVPPVLVIPKGASLSFLNVTVNGTKLNGSSELVAEGEQHPWFTESIFVTKNITGCSHSTNSLKCDLTDIVKNVIVDPSMFSEQWERVEITNAKYLSLTLQCHVNYSIENSNFIVEDCSNCSDDMTPSSSLYVKNSTITFMESRFLQTLVVEESTINYLKVHNLLNIDWKNVVADSIKELNTDEGGWINIRNSTLHFINHAVLKSPLHMQQVHIGTAVKMQFSHPNMTSSIVGCVFLRVESKGLDLEAGNLTLNATIIRNTSPDSIIVRSGSYATVGMLTSTPRKHFITATSRDQVELKSSKFGISSTNYVIVNSNRIYEGVNKSEAVMDIRTVDNEYCQKMVQEVLYSLVCDFSHVETQVQIKLEFKSTLPVFQVLRLNNVGHLILHPPCIFQVTLANVSGGSTEREKGYVCLPMLEVLNSALDSVSDGWSVVSISNSTIDRLAIDNDLREIKMIDSRINNIDALAWEKFKSYILSSHVININSLYGKGPLVIKNSSVENIKKFGFTSYATSHISNCVIGLIETHGMLLFGKLNVMNSTIETLENNAIVLLEGSILDLTNINIKNGSMSSFMIKGGHLNLKNVTIAGQMIETRRDMVESSNMNNVEDSLMDTNHQTLKSGRTTPASITLADPGILQEGKNTSKDIDSSDVITNEGEQKFEDNNSKENEDVEDLTEDEEASREAVGWAGAIIGFFIGVVASMAAMICIQVFRTDRRALIPFHIRWRVREDEEDLVPSDDEMVIRPST